ncbi:hypothetical protein DASC09_001940 [Saccharomycopsis crataegensis]|uniref:Uncharacterized protein n=1 Tax=Saccharomycopsis crataegensis TaxID=43959 RepID=A0AAV5QDV9_9ASCO|nr:hypothetical protein DASC09_001940 [Saccharomycopsis crataegensis]
MATTLTITTTATTKTTTTTTTTTTAPSAFKISKPRNLQKIQTNTVPKKFDPLTIDHISSLILKTQQQNQYDPLISPVYSNISSCSSYQSSNAPLFSAIAPTLTKNNLDFFTSASSTAPSNCSKLQDWLQYHPNSFKVGNPQHFVNYLNPSFLICDNQETRQHIENISYVHNVDDFWKNLQAHNDDGLVCGDDCEQYHYKKLMMANPVNDFEIVNDEQVSQESAAATTTQLQYEDLEYDTNLFEEMPQSPINFSQNNNNEYEVFIDDGDFVVDTIQDQASNFANMNEQISKALESSMMMVNN